MANRNIRKTTIDCQRLLKAISDTGYSIRSLAKMVSRSDRTIRYYLKQVVMPDLLLDDICHFVNYDRPAVCDDWEKVWIAPYDGTFRGRCRECGFTHFFIEGHCLQYRYCPQCGSKKFKEE